MARIKADEVCVGDKIVRPGDAIYEVVALEWFTVTVHLHCVERRVAKLDRHETFSYNRDEKVEVA
ncbi:MULTISPECIES: hypothetical protein [Burkholderia]|jgi:hypothetical protein|uniref:Uncharacterized protein n=1 Tax=Burkholderia contaminans TaxID=488447 RepID=A0AAP1VC30_9BURK|nr:hypothetical protein [Burkholderia contaminans]ELK7724793.1 hypothetical protein [Burkholderia cenocepacia]UTP27906.1 hypothetical protein NMB33_40430 [Burkholderia sp. FXe9]HBN6128720.1 hypothetical protein [Clostridioides difficile]MBH9693747.1 hypothetical protein [Burkholderia contaminans]MBK1905504.1 hypothetical protein [Burkholderia contaminans]